MLTVVKEDGSGKTDANSYADVADGDAYHEGHVYATTWTAASAGNKAAALVMATRLIDASYQFNGWKKMATQALQWPRVRAVDPDQNASRLTALDNASSGYFSSDAVPAPLVQAVCEQARALLAEDRTGDPMVEGMKQVTVVGAVSVTFDHERRMPAIARPVQMMLRKLGSLLSAGSGMRRLTRT